MTASSVMPLGGIKTRRPTEATETLMLPIGITVGVGRYGAAYKAGA
jgi:hypothetical protein